LALALSTFKPTFGVPLAWFMWCRRDYRAVLTGLAFSIVASLPLTCILIRSEGGMRNFVEAVASNHAKTSSLVAPSASPPVDAYTTLARFAGWSNGGLVEPAVMLLCLAVVGCAIGRVARRTTLDGADGWSGACIVLAILVSVHHCPYDALLLALPLTAIAAARRQPWRSMNAKLRWCLFGVTMVVAANYLASESVSKMLGLRGALLTMAASANGLALLVSLAACIALGPFPAKKPPVERMQPTSCCPLTLALSPLRKTPGGEGIPPPNLLREASGPDAVLGCRARDLLDGRKSCSLRLLPRELITKTGPVDHARWNYRPLLGRIERRRFQLAKSMLSDAPYGRLLELGYGSGVFLPELARHGGELFGLDIHPHADQVAAALGQISVRAQLSSGSADRLPYASACFDCVVAVSTLEFIEDLSAASREISRVLKPDGEFVVVTPGFSRLVDLGLKLLTGKSARADFSDRRQRVIATLLEHFEAISHRTCPRLAPSSLTLYHALKLRPLPAQSPPRCSD
jgi:SAM-dependent methyltransferase